jgi:hypothetical protein
LLERQFIRPIVPFVKVSRVYRRETGQYVTSGNATHFYNKAGSVATRLPRRRDNTQHVFIRCTRDVAGEVLTGTVVKVRPELVQEALRNLMETSPIYRDVEYDEDAMRGLREEEVIEADDAEDADDTGGGGGGGAADGDVPRAAAAAVEVEGGVSVQMEELADVQGDGGGGADADDDDEEVLCRYCFEGPDADDADDGYDDAMDTADVPAEDASNNTPLRDPTFGEAPSSRANIVDEGPNDGAPQPNAALGGATADAADVFVDIEDEHGFSADLADLLDNDIQPRFTMDDSVNMVERDADVITAIFPQHFTDGKGGPTTSVLALPEYFRHALMWHDGRFAQDIEWLFFTYKYEIKRKLFGVCVRATKDQPNVTLASLEKARRAAAAADAPEGPSGDQEGRSSSLDEGKRVMQRLSVYCNQMQVRPDIIHVLEP